MSAPVSIRRILQNDKAVYWPIITGMNGDATAVFGAPIEIECWWRDDIRRIKDFWEKETGSRAHVYIHVEMEEGAMIYHGKLADLTSQQKANPISIPDAYEIRRFEKIESIVFKKQFIRKAYI